jgi:hypothetical protein
MAVSVGWLLEGYLVDYKLIGVVSSGDMIAVSETVIQMLASNPRNTVHVLYDVTACTRIPYDIPNLIKALKPFLILPNMGWGIAYGSKDPVTKFTAELIVQLIKVRYRDFKSQEAALTFLAQIDPVLTRVEGFRHLQNKVNV